MQKFGPIIFLSVWGFIYSGWVGDESGVGVRGGGLICPTFVSVFPPPAAFSQQTASCAYHTHTSGSYAICKYHSKYNSLVAPLSLKRLFNALDWE